MSLYDTKAKKRTVTIFEGDPKIHATKCVRRTKTIYMNANTIRLNRKDSKYQCLCL